MKNLLAFEKPLNLRKKTFQDKRQGCHHIKTSQLICRANQMTVFCTMAILAVKWTFFQSLFWDECEVNKQNINWSQKFCA